METRTPGDVTIAILSDIHYAGPRRTRLRQRL